jgi:hypothetical protein
MQTVSATLVVFLSSAAFACADQRVVDVRDDASLRAAITSARPGTRIHIAPGKYRPGVYVRGLKGGENRPVVIEGADPEDPPAFEGGTQAWHLSDCQYVTLRNIAVRGQTGNGINIDDGGSYDTPARHIVLENIKVTDIGPSGNHDGIKLSGVDDFVVRKCVVEGWAGQAIDMVGCHRGLIEHCRFHGKDGFSQHTGPQTKGGSRDIVIRRCLFRDAGMRAVNLGGSTGLAYFRPQGAVYEAKNIVVEGCAFVGSTAPIAFVGVDGSAVRYNTFVRPDKWVMRILQETTEPRFTSCRNGRFEHNLVVFRRRDISTFLNVGPNTQPETFTYVHNLWYCEDRPDASRPQLPVPETGGVYGIDPRLEGPDQNQFKPQNPRATGFGALALPSDPQGSR